MQRVQRGGAAGAGGRCSLHRGWPTGVPHLAAKVRWRPRLERLHVGMEVDQVQAAKALWGRAGEEARGGAGQVRRRRPLGRSRNSEGMHNTKQHMAAPPPAPLHLARLWEEALGDAQLVHQACVGQVHQAAALDSAEVSPVRADSMLAAGVCVAAARRARRRRQAGRRRAGECGLPRGLAAREMADESSRPWQRPLERPGGSLDGGGGGQARACGRVGPVAM